MSDAGAAADAAPVRKLLNLILLTAVKAKASDIHFEPFEDTFQVRNRIDGVLYEMLPVPKTLAAALVARIKVMSRLDIAERRIPQDGKISVTIGGRNVDLRISTLRPCLANQWWCVFLTVLWSPLTSIKSAWKNRASIISAKLSKSPTVSWW